MNNQSENTSLSIEIPMSIQLSQEKVHFPKGIVEIGKDCIIFSYGDILLTTRYQSIISAGKNGLDILLFLRNGNPEEEEDQYEDQQTSYQDQALLLSFNEGLQKKYSLNAEVKGKFTMTLHFQEYDKLIVNEHYNQVLKFIEAYEPAVNQLEGAEEANFEWEAMGNMMAEIVNQDNDSDDN